MRVVHGEKQKDNLAKFFWDMAKVAFTLLVLGPFAKPESINLLGLVAGTAIGFALALLGYVLDGMEVAR